VTTKTHPVRKPRTHFEQVPLEVVKKIAAEEVSGDGKARTGNVIAEPAPKNGGRRAVPARSLHGKRR
jgi:hypothetical protein